MRFRSEAPRQRAHSNERFDDRVLARVTATSDRNVSTTLIQPGLEFRLGWSGRLCGIELSEAAGFLV